MPPALPHPASRAYLRLVATAAAIGVPAALFAAVFLALVHEAEDWLWSDSPAAYLVIGLPVVGALLVLAARRLLPGDGGHPPLEGLGGAPTPLAHAPGIALAAFGTLAFGAVLGPEAPVIALGSIVGVVAAKAARGDEAQIGVLSSAGSFSAMSALFGGPLVAGLLLVEGSLGLGASALAVLLPGLVSAAIGYVIFVGLGTWGGLNAAGLVVPHLPPYHGTHVGDLLIGVAVGIVTALVIAAVRRLAGRIDTRGVPRLGMARLLLGGALLVGLLAELADLLGADSQEVLFSGQATVPEIVTTGSAGIILVALVTKALAYAISLGCGFRGGPIFPAIFLGVGITALPVAWFDVSPTLAVAVGAAAGMAAQTRLLFAPLLFASLLVGHNGLDTVPAAVLASAAAWLVMAALERHAATAGSAVPAS